MNCRSCNEHCTPVPRPVKAQRKTSFPAALQLPMRCVTSRATGLRLATEQIMDLDIHQQSDLDGATGLGHLRLRIQARVSELSPKQRTLARFLLENHSRAIFASASEVGSAVGASAATVVRFAQLLGYDGFLELRDSLRDEVKTFPTFAEQLTDLARETTSSESELVNRVLGWERENLTATAKLLNAQTVARVAETIAGARQTVVVGTGVGGVVVKLVAGHLSRLGLPVLVPVDMVDAVISLANVGPEDIVFGVSFWRFDRWTAEHLHQAKRRGAVTAAIVDSPLYPAAEDVDHMLVVSSTNTGHGPSVVAATAVANALLSAIILTDFDRFSRAIQHVDDAFGESHVYLD
jgi:DNA-binding MurR/RpiR family transcriptional regulator